MWYRRLTGCFLAFALVLSVVAPLGNAPALGGASGGTPVNVQDLQAIIATVLTGGAHDARADVNNDGEVNILDFQFVLAKVSLSHSEDPPERQQATPLTLL